ncbi:MAG TPA: guanylate kinase [Gemmatimonadales bacterium]|nr:guanylate kinase [Gemmatimonadales bacterium]
MTPFVVVLSSPSGGGKSTIAKRIVAERGDVGYAVSATTRPPRPGEVDGVAYHFVTPTEFERRREAGELLEDATYGGYRYGTLASQVRAVLHGGRHALLDIEIAGARQVRQAMPDAVLIFLAPPSGTALAARLRGRGTESHAAVAVRLEQALEEIAAAVEYDYVVVNNDLEDAVRAVNAILDAESRRTSRQRDFSVLLDRLRSEVAAELIRAG